jgi:uncharacterized BrkB/YihY/UPF0761 family membrane protein
MIYWVCFVSALDAKPKKAFRVFPSRSPVDRKILHFSVSIGLGGALLIALPYVASAYPFSPSLEGRQSAFSVRDQLHWRHVRLERIFDRLAL